MVCCGIFSLGCVGIAAVELTLVFYFQGPGLGQLWLESLELFAGGRFKATATDGWRFQAID